MSKAFNEAEKLIKQKVISEDIFDLLDELRISIDIQEVDDFDWLYEAAAIRLQIV